MYFICQHRAIALVLVDQLICYAGAFFVASCSDGNKFHIDGNKRHNRMKLSSITADPRNPAQAHDHQGMDKRRLALHAVFVEGDRELEHFASI